jgi:hypothetical protein
VNFASEELNGETWVRSIAYPVIYEVYLGKTHDAVLCTFKDSRVGRIFFSNELDFCNETLLVNHLPSCFENFIAKLVEVEVRFAIEEVFHVPLLADDSFVSVGFEPWPEL